METSYGKLDNDNDSNSKQKVNKITLGCLIVACMLLITVSIVAGIFGTKLNKSSTSEYCLTTECLQLAADISNTLNTSVDPCHDFYHYVCDGWDDDASWKNVIYPSYGRLQTIATMEKETFLDALFYNTKETLVNYASVQKASAYFQTCYESTVDIETVGKSQFISDLINQTTFASGSGVWDSIQQKKFGDVMAYLTQINFNTLFKLESKSKKFPKFIQSLEFWGSFYAFNVSMFIPLYQEILGYDASTSQDFADLVQLFSFRLYNISTVDDPRYAMWQFPSTLKTMTVKAAFSDLSSIFESNEILDYSQLVYDAYGVSASDSELSYFQYYEAGLPYFQRLGSLIQAEDPDVVQFYIWTSIFYYYLDFDQIFSQTRYETRSDFCFDRTKSKFPFVYGYILFNTLYNTETHNLASSLANFIKTAGTQALIQNATWLDEVSKAAAIKKIENMDLYIGFPPRIKFGDNIDEYYKAAQQSMTASWIDNVESLTSFEFEQLNNTFWEGHAYNLSSGWPEIFMVPEVYDSWLTGINAFYLPFENWFTIPVSISQPPVFDSSAGYPSAMMFGGLGAVTGHEMSHGFDPSGSMYNYNGTMVGSIFTDYSQSKYSEKMECFVEQYDDIVVDTVNGTAINVNGTLTITENVADNAGVWSSWTAWKKYIAQNGNDKSLYGLSLSQEQLFFVGWASLWCESAVSGSVVVADDVHSPNYARVIGPLQNNPHFAKAFSCGSGARMNPKDKCIVW